MKLNKIFSAIFASALLFSGCVKDMPTDSFENIKLDQTFLTIPEAGGSAVLTVTSTEPWKFVINESWPQVLSFSKGADGKTIKAKHDYYGTLTNWADVDASKTKDSWLKVEGTYYTTKDGATIASEIPAGETKITFKADPSEAGREITLALVCGSSKQHFVVRQGSIAPEDATCNEVINGPDGKTYRVRGVCTSIVNTTYGNWYLKDDSHETDNTIYIYGTLNANGEEKKFSEWGLEVGDVVYVEGPKLTYGSTVELVNVTVLDIEKSLLKIVTETKTYAKEGEDFEVKVAFKGRNVDYSIPEEYKDWILVTGITSKEGIPSKLEQNPADTALVAVKIRPNLVGPRSGSINFSSTLVDDETGKESKTEMAYEFTQDGNLAKVEDITEEGIYAINGLTVYAIPNAYTAVLGDGTGFVLCNIDDKHGFAIGTTVDFTGNVQASNGVWQFKNPTVANQKEGGAPVYPEAVKADESYLTSYASSPAIVYVKITGEQTSERDVVIGSQKLYLNAKNPDTKGKTIDATGFLYGHSSSHGNSNFVPLEIKESNGGDEPEEPTPGDEAETIEMSSCFSVATEFVSGTTYEWGSLSCTFTKNNNSTSNYNTGDPGVRFYQGDILSIKGSKTIKKLEFIYYGGKKGPFTADSGEVSDSGSSVIWTGSADTVVLTASAQIRFNKIIVTY